jgi:putative effector of murein hydrolase
VVIFILIIVFSLLVKYEENPNVKIAQTIIYWLDSALIAISIPVYEYRQAKQQGLRQYLNDIFNINDIFLCTMYIVVGFLCLGE